MNFAATAELCAPNVHIDTMQRIAQVESSGNPYAIGVVGGRLQRQPASFDEAVVTAKALEAAGYNYSLGLVQINRRNFARYGLTVESAFDPCSNLRVGAAILEDCYRRAGRSVTDALSCYYSGNFVSGYKLGYVAKVQQAKPLSVRLDIAAIPVVPQMTAADRKKQRSDAAGRSKPNEPASLFVSVRGDTAPAEDASSTVPKRPPSALIF